MVISRSTPGLIDHISSSDNTNPSCAQVYQSRRWTTETLALLPQLSRTSGHDETSSFEYRGKAKAWVAPLPLQRKNWTHQSLYRQSVCATRSRDSPGNRERATRMRLISVEPQKARSVWPLIGGSSSPTLPATPASPEYTMWTSKPHPAFSRDHELIDWTV